MRYRSAQGDSAVRCIAVALSATTLRKKLKRSSAAADRAAGPVGPHSGYGLYKDTQSHRANAQPRGTESINKTVAEVEGQSTFDLYPEEAEQ